MPTYLVLCYARSHHQRPHQRLQWNAALAGVCGPNYYYTDNALSVSTNIQGKRYKVDHLRW